MKPREVIQDIRTVMSKVIEAGLSDQQRYPAFREIGNRESEIYIEGSPNLSASLRDLPYDEAYTALLEGSAFNLKMIDGALIQMTYRFKNNNIQSHRLALFPAPYLDSYEDALTAYENDELFADIVGRNLVRFPIRFDYSSCDEEHKDVVHPKSHLTLGQYKNCRIPATSPVTPSRFISFVVRNFYAPALERLNLSGKSLARTFPESITPAERQISYISP